ncbi:hypothetical protein K8I28_05610 [bacterium]|nr:hypothetical protein [bacterium]
MPKLDSLKNRLVQLPQIHAERNLLDKFEKYTRSLSLSREKIEDTLEKHKRASKVFPSSEYEVKVFQEIKKAAREAKKLKKNIEENPEVVRNKSTENAVIRINDNAKNSESNCTNIWSKEVDTNITIWNKFARVVQGLATAGSQEFGEAIRYLQNNTSTFPKSEEEVERLLEARKKLHNGISNLGLEGSFGKFLIKSANRGSPLTDLFDDEIKQKMNEHDLWDSFLVRLKL